MCDEEKCLGGWYVFAVNVRKNVSRFMGCYEADNAFMADPELVCDLAKSEAGPGFIGYHFIAIGYFKNDSDDDLKSRFKRYLSEIYIDDQQFELVYRRICAYAMEAIDEMAWERAMADGRCSPLIH